MHLMLDLETLSSRPDAAIVAIGACAFRADGWAAADGERPRFYRVVTAESAQAAGGHIDAATVKWWAAQPPAALGVLVDARATHIAQALEDFSEWLLPLVPGGIWGNGAEFDNVVLRSAYERVGHATPWSFRQNRCYRTLKNLRPDIPMTRVGLAHNAQDDAVSQALHAEAILAAMLPGLKTTNAAE